MEDTHKRIDDLKTDGIPSPYERAAYYGVYDGHGGIQTAEMVVESLHTKIFSNKGFTGGDIKTAIHEGFQEMDQFVVSEANKVNSMHGCTCVCCLVLDGTVHFANIGDSEGMLISIENGNVITHNMTKPHKANEPSEKERIESLGGHVFFGRLYGSLAVSRSFGDAIYKRPKTSKDFVSWEPFTITETLTPAHKYMVLACDGLFDVMSQQEVAEFTHSLFASGHDATSVAKSLVIKAIKELQTEDNVTVIVVKIEWEGDEKPHQNDENSPQDQELQIPATPVLQPVSSPEDSGHNDSQNDTPVTPGAPDATDSNPSEQQHHTEKQPTHV
jgi:serine/threonine protein phosphatase PrpC